MRCVLSGFAATLKLVEPLPVPLGPLVTEIHGTLATAVQPQPGVAVMVAEPVPPLAGGDRVLGVIENVHPTPACVTVKVCPAIVKVPMRCVPFGFALALKLVEPFPEPLVGVVMVSQLSLLARVQSQPVGSVNADDPVPPVAATD